MQDIVLDIIQDGVCKLVSFWIMWLKISLCLRTNLLPIFHNTNASTFYTGFNNICDLYNKILQYGSLIQLFLQITSTFGKNCEQLLGLKNF